MLEGLVMCLGIPARVMDIRELGDLKIALVDFEGAVMEVDATFIPDLRPGDYVIIHAGMAIERLDPKEAEESLKIWKELLKILEKEYIKAP